MNRWACVELPALPLQVLLGRAPEWRALPVVVVERESAEARVLFANRLARASGVARGQRLGAALSLCAELRAAALSEQELEPCAREILELLQRHSPRVEPAGEAPGVYWLDPRGLEPLYAGLEAWAAELRAALAARGFQAGVLVGWTRFGSYALAHALRGRGHACIASAAQEREAALRAGLEGFGLEQAPLLELERLGIRTLAELLRLPRAGLARRYGAELAELHARAAEALRPSAEANGAPGAPGANSARGAPGASAPLRAAALELPLVRRLELEAPEGQVEGLLALCEPLLGELLAELERRARTLAGLELRLELEDAAPLALELLAAAPSAAPARWLRLLRLKLEACAARLACGGFGRGVSALELEARAAPVELQAGTLWAEEPLPGRDFAAATRALDGLRATFGEQAVVHALLRDAHLPEAQIDWQPLRALEPAPPRAPGLESADLAVAAPAAVAPLALVRRFHAQPPQLPHDWPRRAQAGELGPLRALAGPFLHSGCWWRREFEREYYRAELGCGELWWIYRDRLSDLWWLQGGLA